MLFFLSIAILATGLADLYAIARKKQTWRYGFKPGTMVWVILLATTGPETSIYSWLIVAGLVCSLAGDIFLVLPSNRFIQGLTSFFMAHLFYIGAFLMVVTEWSPSSMIMFGLLLAVIAGLFAYKILPQAKTQGGGTLQVAVFSYILVIALMVWLACMTYNLWIITGALLFFISDAILAWDRFVHKLSWGNMAVMITYFSAQYLIALSIWGTSF